VCDGQYGWIGGVLDFIKSLKIKILNLTLLSPKKVSGNLDLYKEVYRIVS
jgi:hypothetical protein